MSLNLAWATEWDYLKTKSKNTRGLQCSSEAECVPSMGKALGSCPSTMEKKTIDRVVTERFYPIPHNGVLCILMEG